MSHFSRCISISNLYLFLDSRPIEEEEEEEEKKIPHIEKEVKINPFDLSNYVSLHFKLHNDHIFWDHPAHIKESDLIETNFKNILKKIQIFLA